MTDPGKPYIEFTRQHPDRDDDWDDDRWRNSQRIFVGSSGVHSAWLIVAFCCGAFIGLFARGWIV